MTNNSKKIFEKLESKTKIYLIIIAILLVILCINKIAYIIPSIIIYAAILTYTIWVSQKRKGEVSNYLNELTLSVDSAAKDTLINSPFPLVILETNGNVVWRSSKFNKEFANIGINSYIDDLAKEIKLDIENNSDARNLYSAIKRGDITGMSFMFTIDEERWENLESEHPTRHIIKIGQVFEVSAVTFPAYESTEISARDKEALESAKTTLDSVRRQSLESDEAALELEKAKILTLFI